MDSEVNKIFEAIKNNKCVMVLGPEICEFKNHIYMGKEPKDFDDSINIAYEYYINKKKIGLLAAMKTANLLNLEKLFQKKSYG